LLFTQAQLLLMFRANEHTHTHALNMMKLFFVDASMTDLADRQSSALISVKKALLEHYPIEVAKDPEVADAIIIQEEETTYKGFRYIDELLNDSLISKYLNKVFTINTDDSATGLLRGLYAAIPKQRFNVFLHKAVPYIKYKNEYSFQNGEAIDPVYLAGWCGNTKSNKMRKSLVDILKDNEDFLIKTSQSWYNHGDDEKRQYVQIVKSCKFSLCPAGWAPASIRIYESMALGRCPVIIADDFMPPEGPSWNEFALFFPQRNIAKLQTFLLQNEPNYLKLGASAKENWDRFFRGERLPRYCATALYSLIQSTPKYSREMEIKRWRSLTTYWQNKWTIPQRVINKCRIMLEKQA
jgi:hypothetical protein